jgi:hypothetical protein
MSNYVYLQLDYLLSKITVTIIFLLLTVIILSSLYNTQILEGYAYIDGFRDEFGYDFFNETFIIIEFILVFISIYIGIVLAGKGNQSLMMYSVYSVKTKTYHMISRVLTGLLIIAILIIFVSSTILFIVYLLTPYQLVFESFMKVTFLLFLELLQYFMMTLLFMAVTNHFLCGLMSLLIFWLLEILSYDLPEKVNSIIELTMINIDGYYDQEKSILIFLIVFHFLTISYIIVMRKKDC